MVKVSCVMSAASSRESPYLRGMENTSRSYLSSKRCHAPRSPLRQSRMRARSNLLAWNPKVRYMNLGAGDREETRAHVSAAGTQHGSVNRVCGEKRSGAAAYPLFHARGIE